MEQINLKFGSLMGSFDIVFGSLVAYATVFLLAQGLDEFRIGLIISAANLFASMIQPWLGDKVDRSNRLTLVHVNLFIVIPCLLLLVSILLFQRILILVAMMYLLTVMLQVTLQPFMNAIGVALMNHGYRVNFGVCRGAESATFAVTSSILGILINRLGTNTIIYMAILGYVIYLLILWLLYRDYLKELFAKYPHDLKINTADIALEPATIPFFTKYSHFKFIIFGSFCFFVGHNFINSFMIQIIENVGGNTENMGAAIALAAITEVPIMVLFTRINRYIHNRYILMFASIFFFIKTALTFAAVSVTGVYTAQLMQAFSFGIYIVGSVYYTNGEMDAVDKVKGQSFITTAHTMGGVVGSSLGGWIINLLSVSHGLMFCIVVTLMGVVSYYFGLIHPQRLAAKS